MRRAQRHKIIFMGGNILGCMCLKELLRRRNVEIISVVGRYNDNGSVVDPKAWNASLLRVAMEKRLPFLQPKTVKSRGFLDELQRSEKPDFIISVQFDKILGPALLNYPKVGCVNIQYAVLLNNRGCFPIPWALIDKEPVGVTIHWLDEGIDTADIIATKEVDVQPTDTAVILYNKVTTEALKLFKKYLPLIMENQAPKISQPRNGKSYHSTEYPYNRNIDWTWSARKIDRMVRALTFPSFPSARTYYKDVEVEILNPVEIISNDRNGFKPGQVVDIQPSGLIIQAEKDSILISKVRINQSLIMDAAKFSHQFNVAVGDLFQLET